MTAVGGRPRSGERIRPDVVGLLGPDDPRLAPSSRLADLVVDLGRWPVNEAQEPVRARMLGFAAKYPDALHRTCPTGHFTGSAFVVDATASQALLLFHRKLQRWLQPGGHADGDANLVGVARREATEETGIGGLRIDPVPVDFDIHRIERGLDPPHEHLDIRFLVIAPAGAVAAGNHESEALRWVDEAALTSFDLDDGTRRMAQAAFVRARHHLTDRPGPDRDGPPSS